MFLVSFRVRSFLILGGLYYLLYVTLSERHTPNNSPVRVSIRSEESALCLTELYFFFFLFCFRIVNLLFFFRICDDRGGVLVSPRGCRDGGNYHPPQRRVPKPHSLIMQEDEILPFSEQVGGWQICEIPGTTGAFTSHYLAFFGRYI